MSIFCENIKLQNPNYIKNCKIAQKNVDFVKIFLIFQNLTKKSGMQKNNNIFFSSKKVFLDLSFSNLGGFCKNVKKCDKNFTKLVFSYILMPS